MKKIPYRSNVRCGEAMVNRYGIFVDFTGHEWAEWKSEGRFEGEDLAAKILIAGRVIRISWEGGIQVEPEITK